MFELLYDQEPFNITCMAMKEGDMDGYLVGTESGKIHKLSLFHDKEQVVETYD